MKAPSVMLVIVLAGASLAAQSDELKGQSVTLRACVKQGIANRVYLSAIEIPTPPEGASKSVRYLFDKPAQLRDYLGGVVEVIAQVREVKPGTTELTANDGVLAEPVSAEQPVGTSGSDPAPILTLDINKIRMVSTVCR